MKVIRKATNTKPKSNTTPDFIKVRTADGDLKKIQNKSDIANEMNKQFCEMGAKLAEKLDSTYAEFTDYLPNPNPNHERFMLHAIIESEVEKLIQELDISKSTGVDEISPKIVKWSAPLLIPILT